jgi:hypothetical protein
MTTVLVRQSIGPKEEHLRWLALCTELPHVSRQLRANFVPNSCGIIGIG